MSSMKALQFESFGPPSGLRVREVAMPRPGDGEVLVAVKASGINPSDVKNVAGAFGTILPRIPGRDYAGVVVEGGGADWQGKEVWGSGAGFGVARDGAHSQYVVLGRDSLAEKPAGLSFDQAAAIGVPALTAWTALVDAGRLEKGETLLVTGVTGAVGRMAVDIAHWKGARVIGTGRTERPTRADAFIETKDGADPEALTATVMALTDGRGANLVLDTVGGATFEPALRSLARGGRQVAITSTGTRRVSFDLLDFYHGLHQLIGVDSMKLTGPDIARVMNALREGFADGHLQAPPTRSWSIEEAVAAYDSVAKGAGAIKHVLRPNGG